MNLPLLTSVLSISCIIAVGRRKWWGHLFGVLNCVAFTVIAFKPGQWGYLPSNAVCIVLYGINAWKWRQESRKLAPVLEFPKWRKISG
jgi:nicotinamide riboside transporter PnuC